jgi:murein DD-endopeptidase MepM/ murein hydrolase activator NlpD
LKQRLKLLATESQHHSSKKNRFTIVLVPDEDASKAKNFRLAPWQFAAGLLSFAAVVAVFVMLVITYTPVGEIFQFSNPGLENKYGKELVSLNQRMTGLMEQLIELRSYNIKLRRAMGENVVMSDSGVVNTTPRAAEKEKNKAGKEQGQMAAKVQPLMSPEQQMISARPVNQEADARTAVAFPAILPTEGYMTRGFEPEHNHFGLDIAGKTGDLIVAAADGNIVFSGWTYDDGYIVIVSHSSGFMSFYKHNQSLLRSSGSFVRRGEPIATLGNSGTTSSGPHLHFEIWKDGVPVDPSIYMINYYL